ncbi:MAG TPA: chemotaxis protein CheW [Candidatus Angelobacter sp.]|nr:chemotaxis protein CheW [Candidatus Angelobacter sp.]
MTESTRQTPSFDKDVMLFSVGVTTYAIELNLVKEVILQPCHLTQLPIPPPLIRGLILSRNEIYPLVHLGEHDVDLNNDEARVILVTDGERRAALYAEHLHDIRSLSTTNQLNDEATVNPECIHGVYGTQRGNVLFVDFIQLYAVLVEQADQVDSIPIS